MQKKINWNKKELTEHLMIIDAYINNDPNMLPKDVMDAVKRMKITINQPQDRNSMFRMPAEDIAP